MIVTQEWTHALSCMQQTVLLTAIRGPDGVAKYHPSKYMIRWFRRCVLLGALDHNVFENPYDPRGGSFTGTRIFGRSLFFSFRRFGGVRGFVGRGIRIGLLLGHCFLPLCVSSTAAICPGGFSTVTSPEPRRSTLLSTQGRINTCPVVHRSR